jgi:WD40 repeat protein
MRGCIGASTYVADLCLWDSYRNLPPPVITFEARERDSSVFAISPDGRFVLTGGKTTLTLWDVETGRKIRTMFGHKETFHTPHSISKQPKHARIVRRMVVTSTDSAIEERPSDGSPLNGTSPTRQNAKRSPAALAAPASCGRITPFRHPDYPGRPTRRTSSWKRGAGRRESSIGSILR